MKNVHIFSLLLCLMPALSYAMETLPLVNASTQNLDELRKSPRKTAIDNTKEEDQSQKKPIDHAKLAFMNSDEFIKNLFPALFTMESCEAYPMGISLTEGLQIALVHNNLAKVKNYLWLLELGSQTSFSPQATHRMIKQIEKIELIINACKVKRERTVEQNIELRDYITQMIDINHDIFKDVRAEIPLATGPAALRKSLKELCKSPEVAEKSALVTNTFKNKLVIGLCGILLPAHRLKARLAGDEKKYLDTMGEINTLMWQAYENNPNHLDRLCKLNDSLLSLEEKCNESIKEQNKKSKRPQKVEKKESIVIL